MFQDLKTDSRKSGRTCAICKNNRRNFNGRMYKFPKDKTMFDIWTSKCKVSDENLINPENFVCENHFEKFFLGKKLKKGAIPTLNLPDNNIKMKSTEKMQETPNLKLFEFENEESSELQPYRNRKENLQNELEEFLVFKSEKTYKSCTIDYNLNHLVEAEEYVRTESPVDLKENFCKHCLKFQKNEGVLQ